MAATTRKDLEALFVDADEAEVDRRLREALEGRVGLARGTNRVLARPGLFHISQRDRLLALLLARHAQVRLGIADSRLEASPTDLAEEGQLPLKNCRELLSRLKGERLMQKNDNGYFIPAWKVVDVAEALLKAEEEKEKT